MATLTKGTTFTSGEVVTPAKLNNLVDLATLSPIVTADIADSQITTSKIADANVTTGKIADGAVTSAKLGNDIVLVPPGAVMPFARSTAPSGWLVANGDIVPNGSGTVQGVTANFASLFAAVGTAFGAAGTLPNLQGIFIRGSGSQIINGTTYTGTFGQKQKDEFKSHTHPINIRSSSVGTSFGTNVAIISTTSPQNSESAGGTETRPANIALLYCIKF